MSDANGGCGCGCGGGEKLAAALKKTRPIDGADAVGRDGLLARVDARALTQAVARAVDAGMEADAVAPLWSALEELAALEKTAATVMSGDAVAGELAAQLADVEPWPPKLLSGGWGKVEAEPALQLASVGAIVSAAYVSGALEGGGDEGRLLAARAITALIWRAEPLARVDGRSRSKARGSAVRTHGAWR